MATASIKNIARAFYESSKDKGEEELAVLGRNTIAFLQEKYLLAKAPQILEAIEEIIDSEEGIVRAHITTHSKISKSMAEEIENIVKKRYKARDVILDFKEDSALLGGIKIEVGDEVIDMTLRNKLNTLQAYLIN
jgi:F-type H+-transporting ATPase subunit delta